MIRILFLLLLPIVLLAQSSNWNSVVDLNLSINHHQDRTDLYVNEDGIHILVENGSKLVYYLYSPSGSQIRNDTIDGSISSTFSKVTGWEGTVYVSYKEADTIYTIKSTDAGQNWSELNNITLGSSDSDGLELWTDDNGVHIAYSNDDETYYKLSEHASSSWINSKTVTDESGVEGGRPSITTSSNRVHIGFTESLSSALTRDKYSSTWQSSQEVSDFYPLRISLIATSTKIHALYSEVVNAPVIDLLYRNRDLAGTTWSTPVEIDQSGCHSETGKPDMVVTLNGKMHMVADYLGDLDYREWNGTLSSPFTAFDIVDGPRISASGNDVYVTGITDDGANGYEIKMRQRDFAPLAPTNLSISGGWLENPTLSWDANTEADLDEYKIYRAEPERSFIYEATTSNTSWVDTEVLLGPPLGLWRWYVKAVDDNENVSNASNIASAWGVYKMIGEGRELGSIPTVFTMKQNYPNPFNPETKIQFGLPNDSNVKLEIFNLQGQIVATLVDGALSAGYHTATFDATSFPSGVYFYKIAAGNFTDIKRMLLVK